MGLPIVYIKGSQVEFSKYDIFLSLTVVLILANNEDHYAAFYLGLRCLQGSHELWKSWKTWKITQKSSMHGKIMKFDKNLNNHGKIMEFCEII